MNFPQFFNQDPETVRGMRGTFGPRPNEGLGSSVFASMLQKCIRRGLEEEALYAAFVLYQFGCYPRGQPLVTYLLNRLAIISFEDIGLADPWLADEVMAALQTIRAEPHGSAVASCTLAAVVSRLCAAPKTRVGSWMRNALGRANQTEFCPDGKSVEEWLGPYAGMAADIFSPGCGVQDVLSMLRAKGLLPMSELQAWTCDAKNKKRGEWVVAAMQLYMRGGARRPAEVQPIEPVPVEDLAATLSRARDAPVVLDGELRDAVLDLHTGKRKRTDPDARAHFAVEGARIENERILHDCHPLLREAYVLSKKTGNEGIFPVPVLTASTHPTAPLASSLFEITGETVHLSFKQPTWVVTAQPGIEAATEEIFSAGEKIFVKIADPNAEFAARCRQLRASVGGMVALKTTVIRARVDLDYKLVVLQRGKKNPGTWATKVNRRMDDLLARDRHRVVDILCISAMPDAVPLCDINISCATSRTLKHILRVLIFRKAVMTTDTNAFNMLVLRDGHVMSVDENPAPPTTRATLLSKGVALATAQPIRADIRAAVRTWAAANRAAMAAFTGRVIDAGDPDMRDTMRAIRAIFEAPDGDLGRLL